MAESIFPPGELANRLGVIYEPRKGGKRRQEEEGGKRRNTAGGPGQ